MSKKNIYPIDAVVAVTYRCNSRCIMCDIWKIQDFPELHPSEYAKLPRTLRDINISGGEPFLRTDLPEIIEVISRACPRAHIVISSNGFLVSAIKQALPKILKINPRVGLNISVDGIGEMQERVRRVEHAWSKNLEVIEFAKSIGVKDLGLAFTLNNENFGESEKVYHYCLDHGLHFSMAVAQSSDFYFGAAGYKTQGAEDKLKQEFSFIIKNLLKSAHPKNWARAYFIDGLYRVATGGRRPLESRPGDDFFYLDPRGDVYPSVADNFIMGNLHEVNRFSELWFSTQALQARRDLQGFESNYWFVCTARTGMRRNPLKVARWILSQKILKH
jgi:MoaA/NifB/PqqE/SkfB family radical SAM enzyme